MKMRSWYDEEEDILGVQVRESEYWKSIELPDGIIIDVDKQGNVIGFEIWRASRIFSGDVRKVIETAKSAVKNN